MVKIGDYIKRYNLITVLILLVIGLTLLWGSTHLEDSSEICILMINLGAALIVTGVAILILSHSVGGIEETFEREIIELTSKLDVLPEAKKCGIVHIFESRRKDPNYKKELLTQFRSAKEKEKVLLMSNSLRDFFGPNPDQEYIKAIFEMLRKDVKFKILLLDPVSEAAKDRALVEEKERVEKEGYINSTLFREIKNVAERLENPSTWVFDKKLRDRIEKQINVRFFPYDPTTQLIITDKSMFIEQYHRGGDKTIREALEKEGIPLIDCFGGFVPVFMVKHSAFFARLMRSHFNNIWSTSDVEKRDLKAHNYYQEILKFEENEKKKVSKLQIT